MRPSRSWRPRLPVAILAGLAGLAVLRYAAERIMQSAPDNIQELRERGFLPE